MIERYKLTYRGGIYAADDFDYERSDSVANNWLCALSLATWVHLDARKDVIWLCISDKPRSLKYAYKYYLTREGNKPPAVHFIVGDTDSIGPIHQKTPLGASSDLWWFDKLPRVGWAWIEYDA